MNQNETRESLCPCDEKCPIGEAIETIGGKWKMRILCSLQADGAQHYNDLSRKIRGISPAMLSSSLKELERDGLVARIVYSGVPVRVEYRITPHGSDLWPILHRLAHWVKNEPYDGDEIPAVSEEVQK
ncbi:MAG: helix-turn-helix transcriptional regulator [Clostridia bacterium]|nr:helix-turn-helix transcriptional regulator [Clostridia bacterium]